MNTWLTPVFIGGRPLDPPITGDAFLEAGQSHPAGKTRTDYSFCPGP